MKRNKVDDTEVVTRGILREELKEELRNHPTREEFRRELTDALSNYVTKDEFRAYRSEIFTKLDQIVGQLAQMREDYMFMMHDMHVLKTTDENHEQRLTKLESSSS